MELYSEGYATTCADKPFLIVTRELFLKWDIHYLLFFMEDSLVAIKTREWLRDGRRKAGMLIDEELSKLSIAEIIARDKDNFKIPYKDISKVKIRRKLGPYSKYFEGILKVEGKRKDSFLVWRKQDNAFDECNKILEESLSENTFNEKLHLRHYIFYIIVSFIPILWGVLEVYIRLLAR